MKHETIRCDGDGCSAMLDVLDNPDEDDCEGWTAEYRCVKKLVRAQNGSIQERGHVATEKHFCPHCGAAQEEE